MGMLALPLIAALAAIRSGTFVDVKIQGGRFSPASIRVPRGASIRFTNADPHPYTLEGPGALKGDILLAPQSVQVVSPRREGGRFVALLEERPEGELSIEVEADDSAVEVSKDAPFDVARARFRQPFLYEPGGEPVYGCFTAFDLAVRGETGRQAVLKDIYRLSEELSYDAPPKELAPFLTPSQWERLRPSVSLVTGLGPGAYDSKRFGPAVAATRPSDLHPVKDAKRLGIAGDTGQRDVIVRAASDNAWFNQRVCRLVWARLRGRIARPTMAYGYSNPNGRSPILGGFFDGTGNPSGANREAAVYPNGRTGSYLAWFRIRFDEERFTARSLADQQRIVGREREVGRPLRGAPQDSHRDRTRNDGKSNIVRMPFVYDDGPGRTGLLFVSAQGSITNGVERILYGFMKPAPSKGSRKGPDRLLDYMHFEEAAYYWVPGSPHGSYPGSLRR